tara:strand:- start:336 stop:653 length:318 start_codon:yes stop_codon:yes gene_type:complete
MITIFDAILAIKSDAKVTVQDNDFENILWHDDNPDNISKQQVQEKIEELEKVYTDAEYQRKRAAAYPIFSEFLEAYTEKEILGNSSKWDAYVENYNKVRSDYPKP